MTQIAMSIRALGQHRHDVLVDVSDEILGLIEAITGRQRMIGFGPLNAYGPMESDWETLRSHRRDKWVVPFALDGIPAHRMRTIGVPDDVW
jgi:hypothetical protein